MSVRIWERLLNAPESFIHHYVALFSIHISVSRVEVNILRPLVNSIWAFPSILLLMETTLKHSWCNIHLFKVYKISWVNLIHVLNDENIWFVQIIHQTCFVIPIISSGYLSCKTNKNLLWNEILPSSWHTTSFQRYLDVMDVRWTLYWRCVCQLGFFFQIKEIFFEMFVESSFAGKISYISETIIARKIKIHMLFKNNFLTKDINKHLLFKLTSNFKFVKIKINFNKNV